MDIADNGTFYGQQLPAGIPVIIEVGGDIGGSTVTFGFEDATGVFAHFHLIGTTTPATVDTAGVFGPIYVPSSGKVGVKFESGSAIDAYLKVVPVRQEQARG